MVKVAVIGAGASGLTAIKACLEEGLDPHCFEKSDAIGGLWRFREKDRFPDLACVFKSTIINTSKEIMAFSDFPPPNEFPNYMHNSLVYKYLKMYAENFKVMKHIQFHTSVTSITKATGSTEDSIWNGGWNIEVKNELNEEKQVILFDAVMVCVGHHAIPHIPDFDGLSEFQGVKLHTHDYRIPKQFEDKRVVVVGIGNSAGDAAVDLSRIASQVFLSTRRGSWLFPRAGEGGVPGDLQFNRALTYFPMEFVNGFLEKKLMENLDHDLYGLRPKHKPVSAHPTVNDDLPNRIVSGAVIIKPNIKCFSKTAVEFEDGTSEEDIDAVILGTGYVFKFPFLSDDIVKVDRNQISLYKHVFPPDVGASTLAIIGLVQPIGSTIPLAEMQCRWATRVFKGLVNLPSEEEMKRDIATKRRAMSQRYIDSQRHTIQVDVIPYMDEIASVIGVKPSFKQMFWEDPKFWYQIMFGPSLNYQYRLVGPGKWDGARKAIESYRERVEAPLRTRKVPHREQKGGRIPFKLMLVSVVVLCTAYWLFS